MNKIAIIKLTVPVLMGYIPLGIAFGLLLSQLMIPWYYALLMSLCIFAGSGQFLLLTLLASNVTILEIGVATFLLNLRHTFYGLSLVTTFKDFSWKKYYLIFGLTDETFALLKTADIPEQNRENSYLLITALNHLYWITGGFIGAVLGNILPFDYTGIEFSLTALFVVLSLELYHKNKLYKPFLVAIIIGFLGIFLFPPQRMLILSLCLAAFILIVFQRNMKNAK